MIINHKKLYRLYAEKRLGVRWLRDRKLARGSWTPVALRPCERTLSVVACNNLLIDGILRLWVRYVWRIHRPAVV